MGRWEPNAQGRLAQAALELFAESGYEETTVAEIAARAGLTERTFFRHYADKREVLFAGGKTFGETIINALVSAPDTFTALQAVARAIHAVGSMLEEDRGREFARARRRIILSNPELRERELIKLADVTTATAEALRGRGVPEPTASLTAELGMAVFRVAFDRWVADGDQRSFSSLLDEALTDVAATVA